MQATVFTKKKTTSFKTQIHMRLTCTYSTSQTKIDVWYSLQKHQGVHAVGIEMRLLSAPAHLVR